MDIEAYRRGIEAWHVARIARLRRADGWLSLVGLEWLVPGANRIGSAANNDRVLAKAPAHLGTLTWNADDSLDLAVDAHAGVLVDGLPVTQTRLRDDRQAVPSVVAFGAVNFVVIDRSGRKALRVRDPDAPARTGFVGIERFPVDPDWRIVADWLPLDPPYRLTTSTVVGTVETYPAPGKAVFTRAGQRCSVYPVLEAPDATQLFLMFRDATSGRQTHGAVRFLYAEPPRAGKLVLDFNRAYNPPCAFTAFATCPLAPPENKLAVAVTAGELAYRGGA